MKSVFQVKLKIVLNKKISMSAANVWKIMDFTETPILILKIVFTFLLKIVKWLKMFIHLSAKSATICIIRIKDFVSPLSHSLTIAFSIPLRILVRNVKRVTF